MGKSAEKQGWKRTERRLRLLAKMGLADPPGLTGERAELYFDGAGILAEQVANGITPVSLKEGIHQCLLLLDDLSLELARRDVAEQLNTIDCKKGCFHCCNTRVSCIAPMVLALAAYLRKKLSPEAMADLRMRIAEHVEPNRKLSPNEQIWALRLCPLNVEGACMAYEYRPSGCRIHHSFSVDACRAKFESASRDLVIPRDPARLEVLQSVVTGLSECLKALKLDTKEIEFIPALQVALDEPDAAERYIAGEDVFDAAYRPEVLDAGKMEASRRPLNALPQAGKSR